MFKQNMANWDRIVRAVVAIVFFALILTSNVSGALATVLGILGVVFLLTSVVGFCPLYAPFKFGTKRS
jgi:hypothetical protein